MRKLVLIVLIAVLAGAAQSQLSDRVAIYGSSPDFLIAATMAVGLILDPVFGALFGLMAGLTQASIVGLSFGGFIVSRTLLGFFAASLRTWIFQENPVALAAAALLGTIACEAVYLLIDPGRSHPSEFSQLPMESVYNAILALALYVMMKRAMEQDQNTRPAGL